jgi:hypothetical protein
MGGNSTMYSMVLVASLATAGDAPEFGHKNKGGGCQGAVVAAPVGCYGSGVGCYGSGVGSYGASCHGGGRSGGFLGGHKNRGSGCQGSVVVASPVGCYGGGVGAGCDGGRGGLFSRLGHKNKGSGCHGAVVAAAPCGCCGSTVGVPVGGPVLMPNPGGTVVPVPMDKGKTPDVKPKGE